MTGLEELIADSTASGGSERANYQIFITRLCGVLGVDAPGMVKAMTPVEGRTIEDGIRWLETTPIAALHVATLACQRLDATSALLVELRKGAEGNREAGFLERLFGAVTGADVRG